VSTLRADNRQAKIGLAGLMGTSLFLAALAGFATADLTEWRLGSPFIAVGGGVLLLVALKIVSGYPHFVLGVYGADLHKVLIDIFPLLWGQPLFFATYMQRADYLVAAVTVITLAIVVLRGKALVRRWFSLPVLSQLCLAILLAFGLLRWFDAFSQFKFARFLGGNLLLLLMSVAICRDAAHVRRIWWTWLVMSLILAVGSAWLLSQGAYWVSARRELITLSNIRTGRVSGIAIIYLVTMYGGGLKPRERILRVFAIGLLVLAVLASGSKVSLVGLLVVLGLYSAMYFRRARGPRSWPLVFLVVGIIALSILVLDLSGLLPSTSVVGLEGYVYSIQCRVQLAQYSLSRAFASPLFGSGFSSGDTSGAKAHNIFLELFVMVGISGLALFLLFVISTLAMGWRVLRVTAGNPHVHGLAMASFLACIFTLVTAQVTLDIGGNRDFWLFSGLLLAMFFRYARSKPADDANGSKSGDAVSGRVVAC